MIDVAGFPPYSGASITLPEGLTMRRLILLAPAAAILLVSLSSGADPFRVLDENQRPPDSRLGKPRDYNGYFPWTPPTSKESWEKRRQEVREQVMVTNGIWPLPEKTELKPVIHGK